MSITVAAATLLLFTGAADAVPSTDSVALTCDAEKAAVWNAQNGASRCVCPYPHLLLASRQQAATRQLRVLGKTHLP